MEIRIYSDVNGKCPFEEWINKLKDVKAKAIIRVRIARLQTGNFGDCKSLREGLQELRIDYGPGYRVYCSRQGPFIVLLLSASDKRTQDHEIQKAIDYLKDWKSRG